ncbi:MAG: hypothetical protein AAF821_22350 [Cyanobacteria bacterium P01_D01_bin.156]
MFFYRAYNLTICSELLLPELSPLNDAVTTDVTISRGDFIPPDFISTQTQCLVAAPKKDEVYLHWPFIGTFLIRNGTEIVLNLLPDADKNVVRLFLLGAGLGMLLHQRNLFVLHASSVSLNGCAVAFMGNKGWGKSTTAGALHKRGYPFFSDDVTAIDLSNPHQAMLLPGYGQLKLWPESAFALGQQPEGLSKLHPEIDKRDFQSKKSLVKAAQPLKHIYLLAGGATLNIETPSGTQALNALMRNWYCARFGSSIFDVTSKSDHFLRCTRILKQVPVFFLKRKNALNDLDNIAQLVETHVKNAQSSQKMTVQNVI